MSSCLKDDVFLSKDHVFLSSCLKNMSSCQTPSVYPSKLRDCNLSSSFCFDTGQETWVLVSFSLNMCFKSFAVSSNTYIFAMFFMVLDLRLTKVGTRRSPFFCIYTYRQAVGTYRSVLLIIYSFSIFPKHNPNIFLL